MEERAPMHKRLVALYVILLCMVTIIMIRLSSLTTSGGFSQAATVQSSYGLAVGESRGMIYDRNLKPLVNQQYKNLLAVSPTPEATAALQQGLPQAEFAKLLPLLESGKPTVLQTSRPVVGAGVESFRIPVRYGSHQLAPHVLGYLDGGGQGVTGIEAGYQELLARSGGSVRVRYDINAVGMALGSEAVEVVDSRPQGSGGLVLTLDRRIQQAVEEEARVIDKGAVVVMEVGTGEIVAMASRPDFDPLDVAASLNAPNSPLFNRATAAYSVGSTFKLAVAAAALDSGFTTDYSYVCPGYYQLGEQRYYCHQRAGHWELAMERAVGQSCNPYFINLGQQIGAKKLLDMAHALGYGAATRLAEGVTAAAGTLPSSPDQVSVGELCNLSFGQGTLTATPVQVCQMTAIIAGGGQWVQPTLYKGVTQDGCVIDPGQAPPQRQVMRTDTAATLRQLMQFVVEHGSGKKAQPGYGSAGGKTASAQTGLYQGETEIVHGWFTGFYPADQPRYAITVLEEAGGNGGDAPAQVFAGICDQIALLDNYNLLRQAK